MVLNQGQFDPQGTSDNVWNILVATLEKGGSQTSSE